MKAKEIMELSVSGELKQLSVAKIASNDADRTANVKALLGYINLGVTEIYKRFALATQSQTLSNVVDQASYTMTDDFLYLTYASAVIPDDPDYKPDVPINNEFADFSLFTPSPYQIFVTKDDEKYVDITEVIITYAAAPAFLTNENQTVALPLQFIEPLLHYIGYRAHSSLPNNENEDNTNRFLRRFESSCLRIEREGLYTRDNGSNYKLNSRGYV